MPLWRSFAGLRTLHPQWGGHAYTWHSGQVESVQFQRGDDYQRRLRESPFSFLAQDASAAADGGAWLRRRLAGAAAGPTGFPAVDELAAAGATDYVAGLILFGGGDPARGMGIGWSFATDREGGFAEDDVTLLKATLPAVSLAMMTDVAHTIAAGLLESYLGHDAGRRVHAGAVERGSVESLSAVLLYADVRGFTAVADGEPGLAVIEMLDELFETLTAPLRRRGGQVLKFLGDGMLATFPLETPSPAESCRQALDAAAEALLAIEALNATRRARGKPFAPVDLALHVGEVLYGNVGAADRLDFTVIGAAVNEVARIEMLCEPLGRSLVVSAEFAAALGDGRRLEPLGHHQLRGVRAAKEVYGFRGG